MVNSVEVELNIALSDDISAASRPATTMPLSPLGSSVVIIQA